MPTNKKYVTRLQFEQALAAVPAEFRPNLRRAASQVLSAADDLRPDEAIAARDSAARLRAVYIALSSVPLGIGVGSYSALLFGYFSTSGPAVFWAPLFTVAGFGGLAGAGVLKDFSEYVEYLYEQVQQWVDIDEEPDTQADPPAMRFEPTGRQRLTRQFYSWQPGDRQRLAQLQPGQTITRALMQSLGFTALTSASQFQPGKYGYDDLLHDLREAGRVDSDNRWLE